MLGLLPFDQLFDIISRLRRNDVLECMCVSRQWHQTVPDYASECFRQVKLDTKRDDLDYSGLLERVGCYVNVVVFENFPAWKGKASKVASLLPILCPNIHTLHLYHSFIDKRFGTYLGKYLTQLPRLIHLAITRPAGAPSPSSKFIRAILAYSPRLVSISLTRDARPGALPRDLSLLHARLSFSINLQHLDMADFFIHIHSLEPVLRNCPNLRSLVAYMGAQDIQQEMAILERWCPRIRHLYFPSRHAKEPIHITPAYYAEDDNDDDDDGVTTASKAILLRNLWIQCEMAQHFLDQKQIKYLHLDYYCLVGYIPAPPTSVDTLIRK
ncbi:hypothetical protein O0I10_011226 [Lichtheimia ornata]|uniref:F-box domain-containing protein n=1 Tax=Lichtheimia ornata TaxID=688661 RepID=A0AAD7UV22_9FUNG|nr:uncharacterized protein O0I10_011226 [Lichtheimia ornata]KAJ8653177.1 hypothetical protein O0I10_011226 [Lichtheimia ornata]